MGQQSSYPADAHFLFFWSDGDWQPPVCSVSAAFSGLSRPGALWCFNPWNKLCKKFFHHSSFSCGIRKKGVQWHTEASKSSFNLAKDLPLEKWLSGSLNVSSHRTPTKAPHLVAGAGNWDSCLLCHQPTYPRERSPTFFVPWLP